MHLLILMAANKPAPRRLRKRSFRHFASDQSAAILEGAKVIKGRRRPSPACRHPLPV